MCNRSLCYVKIILYLNQLIMEKISIERLESLNGGGFISGFCAGVSVIRFGAMVGFFALNPAVGGAMTAVVGGCLAYSLFS